ncbi:MAG: hypothetical protein HGGPFJEG_00550 [Ignavibacteria bacterium]|nr:hypothetical protein [Ignavibacteria bacterium]
MKFKLILKLILTSFFIFIFSIKLFPEAGNAASDDFEKMKCKKKLASFSDTLKDLPINEIIIEVGKSFLGTPYVAGTLDENPGYEELTINITGLDCVTFVENCIVFSRLIKTGKTDFEDYKKELEKIRYRNGVNAGYPSRLHYFSDWIYDNEKKGILKDITHEIGGKEFAKIITFMTAHKDAYKQMENSDNYMGIYDVEEEINKRRMFYIPKGEISLYYDLLKDGDIIGLTSTLAGLDVAHTGFVYKKDGKAYLMHASLKNKEVEFSAEELEDYMRGNQKQGGIMVARLNEIN